MSVQFDVHAQANGSCMYTLGNTRVLCIVRGPREPLSGTGRRTAAAALAGGKGAVHGSATERLVINVNVISYPFSTLDRRKRVKNDRRIGELQDMIEALLATLIQPEIKQQYSEINIELHVLADDGGLAMACINSCILALVDAAIPIKRLAAACSAGILPLSNSDPSNTISAVVDINQVEAGMFPHVTVATYGRTDELAAVISDGKIAAEQLPSGLAMALAGAHQIYDEIESIIMKRGQKLSTMLKSSS